MDVKSYIDIYLPLLEQFCQHRTIKTFTINIGLFSISEVIFGGYLLISYLGQYVMLSIFMHPLDSQY